jgi:hypothetical protein
VFIRIRGVRHYLWRAVDTGRCRARHHGSGPARCQRHETVLQATSKDVCCMCRG